jgi:hypothetical protein
VDEAHDFEDTWWIVLPDLLRDPEQGVFYVFLDDNWRLYRRLSNIPMEGDPFYPDENWRNTQHIHAALSPSTRVTTCETRCRGPQGRPVEHLPAADAQEARRPLQHVFHRLMREEGVQPEDIVVLTPAPEKRSTWPKEEQIGPFILTWGMETDMEDAIRVCTVYRYSCQGRHAGLGSRGSRLPSTRCFGEGVLKHGDRVDLTIWKQPTLVRTEGADQTMESRERVVIG